MFYRDAGMAEEAAFVAAGWQSWIAST